MKCIYCGSINSKVIDSRMAEDGSSIRRRRECLDCHRRYTTHETVEQATIYVIKKGGGRQEFDISKIRAGILKACEKRPVPIVKIERVVNDIQKEILACGTTEISTEQIGDLVMEKLMEIDDVAYVRYCSVYKEFKDVESFLTQINELLKKKRK